MSAKKPIVVRMDGKQANPSSSIERNRNMEKMENVGKEQVAAAEESSENIHTFAREYDTSSPFSKSNARKKNYVNMFKPVIIAIISAITIGSIMGFVMLKIIVNFDNDINASPAYLIPGQGQEKGDEDKGNTDTSTKGNLYSIEPMSAFVLQGGVFSSAENAEAESTKFIEQGYSPVIWEKDSQYFLLVSSGNSKEDLQDDINVLSKNGIDVYAKEWSIGEVEVKLTKEEYNWISTFQDNWNIALGKSSIEAETWNKLIAEAPKGSESFDRLISNLSEQVSGLNDKNVGPILLALWASFDSFLSTGQMELQ